MTVQILRGDARALPLADNTVDLVVTSPPYACGVTASADNERGNGPGSSCRQVDLGTGSVGSTPGPLPPTTPGVVLDPFGGTGTTALAALALGRHVIHVDLSADYNRIARWRTTDRDQLAKAMQVTRHESARDADLYDMDPLFPELT